MSNNKLDMDVLDFARKISMLTTYTPLSNQYDTLYGQKDGVWWSCQREHLTVWCLHYPTVGVKGFEHIPSNSARKMYNSFGRSETLLWLAEALGEDRRLLSNVIEKAMLENNARSACKVVRDNIPFERIMYLLSLNIG